MGIYDREYYRDERPRHAFPTPRTAVGWIILLNVALFVIDGLFWPTDCRSPHYLTNLLVLHADSLLKPLYWYQLLTYGFAHDPANLWHIGMNMLGLWFLGRIVEQLYGTKEFLRIYVAMVVFGGVVWAGGALLAKEHASMLGASGAVSGVVLLFILNFPHQTLMLFPIPIPIKAWVLGVLLLVSNVAGAFSQANHISIGSAGNVAFTVHLAGMLFAVVYQQFGWNLGRLTAGQFAWPKFRRPPKFRVHDPDDDDVGDEPLDMSAEVDRILEKIHRQGEDSLTRKERRFLETASREYQKRRRDE